MVPRTLIYLISIKLFALATGNLYQYPFLFGRLIFWPHKQSELTESNAKIRNDVEVFILIESKPEGLQRVAADAEWIKE